MDEYLAFAKDLARQGGKLIKDNFESDIAVESKPDNSPVTWVDKQINDLIIQAVSAAYPEHGLLGEEADLGDGSEEYQWLCDPLDGTKCFVLGVPQSTCMLALTKDGQILLSVVYDPFTDRLYHAVKGQGAFCNDKPITVNNQPLAGGYILAEATTSPLFPALEKAGALIEPVAGTGYKCCKLASGKGTAILKTNVDFHDIGPGSLLIEEAGGKVSAYDGSPLRYDRLIKGGVILSNGVAHDDLLALVAGIKKSDS
jgi:myo-inositol-1(or 4)-monophosphatase